MILPARRATFAVTLWREWVWGGQAFSRYHAQEVCPSAEANAIGVNIEEDVSFPLLATISRRNLAWIPWSLLASSHVPYCRKLFGLSFLSSQSLRSFFCCWYSRAWPNPSLSENRLQQNWLHKVCFSIHSNGLIFGYSSRRDMRGWKEGRVRLNLGLFEWFKEAKQCSHPWSAPCSYVVCTTRNAMSNMDKALAVGQILLRVYFASDKTRKAATCNIVVLSWMKIGLTWEAFKNANDHAPFQVF